MILAIDPGLRALSLCCMSCNDKSDISTYNIHLWEVYNTLDSDDYKCTGVQKNGKICNRKCSFKYNDTEKNTITYCCKSHFPKTLDSSLKIHQFKKKSIDDYLLQDIANIVISKIQEIYDKYLHDLNITSIFIELQPKVNRKSVFTSHILYGKFVDLYKMTSTPIRFVRASQKLKSYTGPPIECKLKGAYAKRKWLSIQYTKWFLENKFSQSQRDEWLSLFNLKKIQADCGDTFLMAINALYGIPKKQKFQKNGKCIK